MKPLLICDCDEVLLHFVGPFEEYLRDSHQMTLSLDSFALSGNIRRADGSSVDQAAFLPLLEGFFDTHMTSQTPAQDAPQALAQIAEVADIIILTNISDRHASVRSGELKRLGMPYRVIGNAGPKGMPVASLVAEFGATRTVFVDDLPHHHASVKSRAPAVHRLHMVADPRLRDLIPRAPDADVRLDTWALALPHILAFMEG
jgi:hypothetical protein